MDPKDFILNPTIFIRSFTFHLFLANICHHWPFSQRWLPCHNWSPPNIFFYWIWLVEIKIWRSNDCKMKLTDRGGKIRSWIITHSNFLQKGQTFNSDTIPFWHYPILTPYTPENTFQFWHLPIPSLSDSDTFQFWHFQILTLCNSGTFHCRLFALRKYIYLRKNIQWNIKSLHVNILTQCNKLPDQNNWHFLIIRNLYSVAFVDRGQNKTYKMKNLSPGGWFLVPLQQLKSMISAYFLMGLTL